MKEKRNTKKKNKVSYGSYAYKTLKIIGGIAVAGVALTTLLVAPNLARVARPLFESLQNGDERAWRRERKEIRRALKRLRERRLIKLVRKGNKDILIITVKGKQVLKDFALEDMNLPVEEKWDEKWRLVLFDIPEGYKQARDSLRKKLLGLGFYSLQKSVFVYPYDCQDEIDFIIQFFGIASYVEYVVCDSLGPSEGKTRKFFGLLT